jgi:hypothetical protein
MSGSLPGTLDLARACHLGKQDGGGKRADSLDGAKQLMIAGELLVRADLLGDELFQARFFRAECGDDALQRTVHIGSDSFQPVLFPLQHQRDFFPATHQSLQLRHFHAWWLPRCRLMSANKIGDDGGIQPIGFVAIAGAASVLFDSSWVKQAHPMALAMEP